MANTADKAVTANTDQLKPILTQTKVEHQMLGNAKEGLLATLNWQTEGDTFARKLSSLRFAARTYQEHLERVLALEEHDGYMDIVVESCPHFSRQITQLRKEHEETRVSWDMMMTQLERLMANDHAGLQNLGAGILDALRKYDDHCRQETALIQEALLRDYGCGD